MKKSAPPVTVNFLSASVPLTKMFYKDGSKDSYPLVKNFTGFSEQVSTIEEFHAVLVGHSLKGRCMLKGALTRPLVNEPRAGTTRTNDKTSFICLDFDRYETDDIDMVLHNLGLGNISYVLQYSASHGLPEHMGTVSAHVFMLLDQELPAPMLKTWLMDLNLSKMTDQIILSRSKNTLRWPLDVTTCQNDKLIYIAPPVFENPADNPLTDRVRLVKRTKARVPVSQAIGEGNLTLTKKNERELLNVIREKEGLPKRRASTSWVGGTEVINKPDVCEVTGIKDCGDYVRLNLNGGDSWAYWHTKTNFELIHDFKSDTWYRTKELLPEYYRDLKMEQGQDHATPSEDGDLILAFSDLKTGEYYRGLWNPGTKNLELYRARNETQLQHWWMSHGRNPPEFIPTWDITYDPKDDWIVDEDNHRINMFRKTEYMDMKPNKKLTSADFPSILWIIKHMLGEGSNSSELSDHFLNWFAVIFQRKAKPLTAWVTHGTEGTGKGYFFNKIARPLLGIGNSQGVRVDTLEDQFNSWLENALFIFVDEVDVDDFREKGRVTAKLRNYITEPIVSLRRMRQAAINVENFAAFLFSSNRPQPVFIPETDRRYNVGNFQPHKLGKPDDDAVSKELEAFAQWLLAHKADVTLANQIVHTEARALIQKLGISSMTETCNAMKNGDFDALWMAALDDDVLNRAPHLNEPARVYNSLMRSIAQDIIENGSKQNLSRDEMGIILQYNVGNVRTEPNRLTSLLRHNGIETKQLRHRGRKTYGIHVDWKMSDEIREEAMASLGIGTKPKLRRAK